MRILFLGTPDFAVASLRVLVEGGHEVVGVVTMPDKPAGRGLHLQKSAVKTCAEAARLPIFQPEKLRDPEFLHAIEALQPDLGVVIAFRMLPRQVWALPRLGTLNLHASLLPQYRGAAPINRAIMNGETVTGVTTFLLNEEIDTGAILGRRRVEITPDDTAATLHDKLMTVGAELVLQTVSDLEAGVTKPENQPTGEDGLHPAPKIFRDDCRIDWSRSCTEIRNFVRGLSPYPAAWSVLGDLSVKIFEVQQVEEEPRTSAFVGAGETQALSAGCEIDSPGTIRTDGRTFLHVACADGWLAITDLQLSGKRRMPVADLLRGFTMPDRF